MSFERKLGYCLRVFVACVVIAGFWFWFGNGWIMFGIGMFAIIFGSLAERMITRAKLAQDAWEWNVLRQVAQEVNASFKQHGGSNKYDTFEALIASRAADAALKVAPKSNDLLAAEASLAEVMARLDAKHKRTTTKNGE
jgi:hypothetical protein